MPGNIAQGLSTDRACEVGAMTEGNTRFFISNTFISNARLKVAKNQINAKQHPEAE